MGGLCSTHGADEARSGLPPRDFATHGVRPLYATKPPSGHPQVMPRTPTPK
jgi:hypothetical protein